MCSCDQCESQIKWKLNLTAHFKTIHGYVDNSCEDCDHKAIWKLPLKHYIESVHGNLSCPSYQYEQRSMASRAFEKPHGVNFLTKKQRDWKKRKK